MSQRGIPCYLMRGGTSKGPFFLEEDLPQDITQRDQILLRALGSPNKLQIDGIGGGHPLTSKVGIVKKSDKEGVDLEFLFAQLQPNTDTVDTKPNCGNMLAAVVPFALERGLVEAKGETSTYCVLTRNTGMLSNITVQTPNKEITYIGEAHIDGVPNTSAPINIEFLDTAGSVCDSLLPTGNVIDVVNEIPVTCMDNGMPVVLMRASDMGIQGDEAIDDLNQNELLKEHMEEIRLEAAKRMGLGDVSKKNYPKMCLISKPKHNGALHTRCFIPHVCHESIGVLAAVTIATACALPGSVCEGIAVIEKGRKKMVSIEHPSGEFTLEILMDKEDATTVERASLIRTARLLMKGEVMIPNE